MRAIREAAFNVPEGYGFSEDRLLFRKGEKNWTLYVSDHYWVLDIEGYLEFYYNPEHGMGKIEKTQIPDIVIGRLKKYCVMFNSNGEIFKPGGVPVKKEQSAGPLSTHVDFKRLEDRLTIGNWFYAQGYNYVTADGKFYEICFPYDSYGREWNLWDMRLHDMVRMTASTKTHYYIRSIWDLNCFESIDHRSIIVKPFREHEWDSALWAQQFEDCSKGEMDFEDRSIIRFMRQEVFFHTVYLARLGWYISGTGNKVLLPDTDALIRDTRLFSAKISVACERDKETRIFVENKDCLLSAREWRNKGYHVAVLNMASRQNPGGGVYDGAGAQEENIFRRTNLFQSMYIFAPYAWDYGVTPKKQGYPLDRNFGGIYSPDVTVFRGVEEEGYPLLDEPFSICVISVPGMNRPKLDRDGMIVPYLVDGIKNKIRNIFDIALLYKHDCIILGALGCGALQNPPEHIAGLFHELLESEYKNMFEIVVFAILDDRNSGKEHNKQGNFLPFQNEFNH